MALLRFPLVVLRWIAVVLAALAWLIVVPIVDVLRGTLGRLLGLSRADELDDAEVERMLLDVEGQWQEPEPESRNAPPASGTNSQA